MKKLSEFLLIALVITVWGCAEKPSSEDTASSPANGIDYRKLVSRADLVHHQPVTRSEAGLPVGNGRMGSLVWTTPASLKMQINRVDVFAMSSTGNSFPRRHTDYASGCGYVDINLVDFGDDVFTGKDFRQHLSVYDGIMTTEGKDVTARALAWHERDVMAIEIEDQRKKPVAVNVDLRMLRYMIQYFPEDKNFELTSDHAVSIQTTYHTATSRLDIRDGNIILTQEFSEGDHYNTSAVAIGILGRESKARYLNESTVQLSAAPGQGRFTILVASASSFDPDVDVADLALEELKASEAPGFEGLLASNKAWWQNFWSKSFVHLHSEDGVADYVEKNYTYFQYVMASSSRGSYPPRFGGMIWYTTGDMRMWGSQYWWHNQSCMYNALTPTNRFDIMEPIFSMYSRNYDSYATAARQQWGSKGVWMPETTWFDGFEEMPDDIAKEMQDLYLLRKPWEERSARFKSYVKPKLKHNSRLNWSGVGHYEQGFWEIVDKGAGPFGHVVHILSTTGKISYQYWLRYEYTQDTAWLREFAYPMLRGTVEFYRNFPNLKKDANGKYNIYHVNNQEPVWNAQNPLEEISAMRGITPILIRASEILDTDVDMRTVWKEFGDNIAPYPTSEVLTEPGNPPYWISAIPPAGWGDPEAPDIVPALFYDLCNMATVDKEMIEYANATYDILYPEGFNKDDPIHTLIQNSVAAAHLGRANDLMYMIPNQIKSLSPDGTVGEKVLPNRLALHEGPGAIDIERIGNASAGLHKALIQSVPPAPGKEPVIYLFPAWPAEWDASFKLGARGAFLVSASIEKGEIKNVEIESQVGGECRIINPWPDQTLDLLRNQEKAEEISGSLLIIPTVCGEKIDLVPH